MAKKSKKKSSDLLIEEITGEVKHLKIVSGKIVDGFCHYGYEVLTGVSIGDKINIKGAGRITDDMYDAFTVLNKHLACIDDIFEHSGIEVENIDNFNNHELVALYIVDGIKISGPTEAESIELSGSKSLSCGGRAAFTTPKIALDSLGAYKWYNELKDASDKVRLEIELYREGKKVIEDDEDKPDPKQLNAFHAATNTEDFEDAKL